MGAPYGIAGTSLEKTTLSQFTLMEGFPSNACSIGPKAQLHGNLSSLEISIHGRKSSKQVMVEMDIKDIKNCQNRSIWKELKSSLFSKN